MGLAQPNSPKPYTPPLTFNQVKNPKLYTTAAHPFLCKLVTGASLLRPTFRQDTCASETLSSLCTDLHPPLASTVLSLPTSSRAQITKRPITFTWWPHKVASIVREYTI
ncbi:hypothetical protein HanPI659440_Chr15g0611341 [Helianthus annuus]|nr:hypothetical protein HanPI659440_Chr15g0603161 [Helianthus annuus]KAJ0694661.1 hypothetical protein HanPI659440_Chr15g0611341 [Helianthus annuus]